MNETLLIAVNVFRQLLRNRILVVLAGFALALVGVVVFLGDLGQEAETRLGRDFGLLALEWVGFFTVLLCHVVLLFEESELKTLAILLVKPIRRWHYLLGKILGSMLLLLMNQALMTLLLGALAAWRGLTLVDGGFLVAAAYLWVAGCLFSCVAAFASVMASSVPAAAMFACFAFGLGHFTSNLLEWVERMRDPWLAALVRAIYYLTPNFSLFNLKESLEKVGATLSLGSVFLWPLAYAVCYGGLVLSLALWRYERKEF